MASALSSLPGRLSGVGVRVFDQVQRTPVAPSATEPAMILVDLEMIGKQKSTSNARRAGGIKLRAAVVLGLQTPAAVTSVRSASIDLGKRGV